MRVFGLVSGGKDSVYSLMECVRAGHSVVGLGNLFPVVDDPAAQDINSFMFQTVGFEAIPHIAAAMQLPLFRRPIKGTSACVTLDYSVTPEDEVEDLLALIQEAKDSIEGGFDAVSVGAIASNYQRLRVENVCSRLGLSCLSPLWLRDQRELLTEMIDSGINAVLIKTAGGGIPPERWLGKSIEELKTDIFAAADSTGVNECGEGGEYESLVLDCPLFHKKLVVSGWKLAGEDLKKSTNPSGFAIPESFSLAGKSEEEITAAKLKLAKSAFPAPAIPDKIVAKEFGKSKLSYWETSTEAKEEKSKGLRTRALLKNGFIFITVDGASTFSEIASECEKKGIILSRDILCSALRIPDMGLFGSVNKEYSKAFSTLPVDEKISLLSPSRSCVQVCSEKMSASFIGLSGKVNPLSLQKSNLHVRSISKWAPACIGPYSQVVSLSSVALLAGTIGLNPFSMDFDSQLFSKQPVEEQFFLAWKHVNSVLRAIKHSPVNLIAGFIFVRVDEDIFTLKELVKGVEALKYLPISWISVPNLPKSALVEIQFVSVLKDLAGKYSSDSSLKHRSCEFTSSTYSGKGFVSSVLDLVSLSSEDEAEAVNFAVSYLKNLLSPVDDEFVLPLFFIWTAPAFVPLFESAIDRVGIVSEIIPVKKIGGTTIFGPFSCQAVIVDLEVLST